MGNDTLNNIAIITARGGSKRIPKKNIKPFCNKPIIAYSIESALKSKLFDEVMVSTDDDEIKEIAIQYGAKVPFVRSENNSNDFATTSDVLIEVLLQYQKINMNFENACCIYPTAPFVDENMLIKAFNILKESNIDSVLPIVPFSFPILRSFIQDEKDYIKYNWEEYRNIRSQDLPNFYHDAGQFYFFKVAPFLQSGKVVNDKTKGIRISELQAQDIDNITDWKLAEMKFELLKK